MSNRNRFIPEPYKGQATRFRCPACNHNHEFTKYIDLENQIEFPDDIGICNRQVACGYHKTPKMYFEQNKGIMFDIPNTARPVAPPRPVDFISGDVMQSTLRNYDQNEFIKGLKLRFSPNEVDAVLNKYYIGTSKHWQGSTVFWQVDILGRVRQAKVIPYQSDTLKRNKDLNVWFAGKTILKNLEANLQQCFYGESQLKDAPLSIPVAIVESEKTAVICSIAMPQFIWLATGGSNGCKWLDGAVNGVLKGRAVTLFPDNDAYELWTKKAVTLQAVAGCKVKVSDILKTKFGHELKYDLADVLLNDLESKSQPYNEAEQKTIASYQSESYPTDWNIKTSTVPNLKVHTPESWGLIAPVERPLNEAEIIELMTGRNPALQNLINTLDLTS